MKTNQIFLGKPRFIIMILVLITGIYRANATTTKWTGAISTAWSLSTNWTAGVPTSSVDAVIDNATVGYTQDPTLDNTGLACLTLSIDNGASLNGGSGNSLTISGLLNGTGILNGGSSTFTVSGDMVVAVFNHGSSTIVLNGSTQSIDGYTFNNLTISSGTTSFANSIVVNGTLTISSGAELIPGASNTITGTGTLTGNGTIDVNNIGTGDNFGNQYGMTTQTMTNLVVKYTGTSNQQIGANTFGTVIIANSNGVSAIGTITIGKNLTLSSGTLSASWQTINIGGNITGTGSNFSAGTGQVVMNGSSSQFITGVTFNDLIIDNTSGGVTLISHGNSTVSDSLTLTNGILTTDASDLLILTSTTPYSGGSNSSYVDGPVQNNALSGSHTSFIFPLGNSNKYAPLGIGSIGSSATFTAQYFRSTHSASTSGISGSAPKASSIEYWTLQENTGSSSANVTLNWKSGASSGITNVSDITIYFDNGGGSWADLSGTPTGTTSSGSVTASATSTQLAATPGFFTFGDNTGTNPLPVSLISFTAQYKDNQVILNWSTASEQNNSYFDVERSIDAANWTTIDQVRGHGTTNAFNSYSSMDNLIDAIPSGTFYYRLKQVDFNGAFAYSMIRSVDVANQPYTFSAYPNPTNSTLNVIWTNNTSGNTTVKLVNAIGIIVYEQSAGGMGIIQKQVDLSGLTNGIYYLQIIKENNTVINRAVYKN